MAEPVVLSGSSLDTFLRCARQWEFAYVYRLKRPPSLRMALGIAAHRAVEVDLQHKVKHWEDLPQEQVVETFVDSFRVEAEDSPEQGKETKGSMLDSGVKAVRFWHDVVAPTTDPVEVELHGQFTVNGIPYDWTIDEVDQDARIRDWKFVGRKPSDNKYIMNMIGYAVGYRHLTGKVESGVQLDNIVRTKDPQHVIIGSGTVPDDAIQGWADTISEDVYPAIQAGHFPPTGVKSNACSWCGYLDLCAVGRASITRKDHGDYQD